MQKVTLVITYITDSYDDHNVEAYYPDEVSTKDAAIEFDISAHAAGELTLTELIQEDSIEGIRLLGVKELGK